MQSSDILDESPIVKELSNVASQAFHELEITKQSLKEKELELIKKYLEKQVELKTDALIKSQKMAIIGELTSRLAHDLRNPLSVIKTAHGIMKEKPKMDVKQRLEYNARIDRALLRIIHLVNDVLGFVRITDLDLNEASVLSLIDSAIDSIDVPKQIEIIKPTDDFKINCDFRKLEAVFANLLTNSIQAIENEGKIELRLSSDKDSIKLEIEDTGSGIPKSIMPKIFDPLFTTKSNGTGLGLAICKTIIEQHGGTITVKSNPTTFTIILPKNQ